MKNSIINYNKLFSNFTTNNERRKDDFVWFNYSGFLNESAFKALCDSYPEKTLFEEHKGMRRIHGQNPHDRLYLAFKKSIHHPINFKGTGIIQMQQLTPCWQDFLGELMEQPYNEFIHLSLGLKEYKARYDWHIGINGSEVSPHIDAKTKLASHLFYFNTSLDWKPEWGGRTLLLYSKKTKAMNPPFEDFDEIVSVENLNNKSLLFKNSQNAWHGVEALKCPGNCFRKLFNVIFEVRNAEELTLVERANM